MSRPDYDPFPYQRSDEKLHLDSNGAGNTETGRSVVSTQSRAPIDSLPDVATTSETARLISLARKYSPVRKIALMAFLVIATAGALTLYLLLYLFALNDYQRNGVDITTTASSSTFTTISSAISTVVVRTVPIVVSLHAYQLAARWLEASTENDNEARPSPLQLGLLMSILRGANIVTFIKVQLHFFQLSNGSKHHTLAPSRLLKHAAASLGLLLVTAYLVTSVDTWLHLTSKGAHFIKALPHERSQLTEFGRQINETRCTYYANQTSTIPGDSPFYGSLCGIDVGEYFTFMNVLPQGARTFGNTSLTDQVAFTDDQVAILVPASIPPSVTFDTSSIGVQSSCRSITPQCLHTGNDVIASSPYSVPLFNCTGAPPLSIDNAALVNGSMPFGVVNSTTNQISPLIVQDPTVAYAAQTNPFDQASIVMSTTYGTEVDQNLDFVGDTGFFYSAPNSFNVIYCTVTVQQVLYRYTSLVSAGESVSEQASNAGSYKTLFKQTAPVETATLFGAILNMGAMATFLPQRIEGAGLEVGTYADAYALELSSELMAFGAALFEPVQVQNIHGLQPIVGTTLSLVPLVLFAALITLYCCITMYTATTSALISRSTPFVHLAHRRITSSISLINLLYGSAEIGRTWQPDELERFSEEAEDDRLDVGPVETSGSDLLFNFSKIRHSEEEKAAGSRQTQALGQGGVRPSVSMPTNTVGAVAKARLQDSTNRIIMFSSALIAGTAGPMIVVLLYIFVISDWHKDGLIIQTTARRQFIVGVSNGLSAIISIALPIVITLYAFHLAAGWLQASNEANNKDRPSPRQLGLLMALLEGADIFSFGRVFRHLTSKTEKTQSLPASRLLVRGTVLLGLLLVVTNAATGIDLWLHSSTEVVFFDNTFKYYPTGSTLFGRTVNETLCSQYPTPFTGATSPACGLLPQGNNNTYPGAAEGQRTLSNSSVSNRIAFTDDQHAIIIPNSIPSDVNYNATTLGVQASCASITDRCVHLVNGGVEGSLLIPAFNCTGLPRVNVDNTAVQTSRDLFGVVDQAGNISGVEEYAIDMVLSNPFSLVGLASSYAPLMNLSAMDTMIGDTGFFAQIGTAQPSNLLYCNITVRDVSYSYVNGNASVTSFSSVNDNNVGSYHTLSYNDSSVQNAKYLAAPMDWNYMQFYIQDRTSGAGLYDGSYADAYAMELSREIIAFSAFIYEATQVDGIEGSQEIAGSRIHLIALALYCTAIFIFDLLTFGVTVLAIIADRGTPFVRLAHMRITSPLPLVHSLFGPVEPSRTWQEDGVYLFSAESDGDRLNIGPVSLPNGESVFVIARASDAIRTSEDGETGRPVPKRGESDLDHLKWGGSSPKSPTSPRGDRQFLPRGSSDLDRLTYVGSPVSEHFS